MDDGLYVIEIEIFHLLFLMCPFDGGWVKNIELNIGDPLKYEFD